MFRRTSESGEKGGKFAKRRKNDRCADLEQRETNFFSIRATFHRQIGNVKEQTGFHATDYRVIDCRDLFRNLPGVPLDDNDGGGIVLGLFQGSDKRRKADHLENPFFVQNPKRPN